MKSILRLLLTLSFTILLCGCVTEQSYIIKNTNLKQVADTLHEYSPLTGYHIGYFNVTAENLYARIDLGKKVRVIPSETIYERRYITEIDPFCEYDQFSIDMRVRRRPHITIDKHRHRHRHYHVSDPFRDHVVDRVVKEVPAQRIVSHWYISIHATLTKDGIYIYAKANEEFDPGYFLEEFFNILENKGAVIIQQ